MGRIMIELPDDVEREFRHRVIERFGGKKGGLSLGMIEAIRAWLKQTEPLAKKK
jgi:hypothetical protein